jgi:hypothetical protein
MKKISLKLQKRYFYLLIALITVIFLSCSDPSFRQQFFRKHNHFNRSTGTGTSSTASGTV